MKIKTKEKKTLGNPSGRPAHSLASGRLFCGLLGRILGNRQFTVGKLSVQISVFSVPTDTRATTYENRDFRGAREISVFSVPNCRNCRFFARSVGRSEK